MNLWEMNLWKKVSGLWDIERRLWALEQRDELWRKRMERETEARIWEKLKEEGEDGLSDEGRRAWEAGMQVDL